MSQPSGGELVAQVLAQQRVRFLFTLCGGHISPILVAARAAGLSVIDVRHEATAVFAADACARLSGTPGVAAVTAGPGVTNAVTALQNARMAQVPLVLLAGATATVLKGRGSLQDIDQMSLLRPIVKRVWSPKRVRDLVPDLEAAFHTAQDGVPGPVAVEFPVDLLYPESVVRSWYLKERTDRLTRLYLTAHLQRQFAGPLQPPSRRADPPPHLPDPHHVDTLSRWIGEARKPVLVLGSGAITDDVQGLVDAVEHLGMPTFLGGMARGLLGIESPIALRHQRSEALKQADLVIVAGFPLDFRLNYGRHVGRHARLVMVHYDEQALRQNRRPSLAVNADPTALLRRLHPPPRNRRFDAWLDTLRQADKARDDAIRQESLIDTGRVNPLRLCLAIDRRLTDRSIIVVDGGDFAATASYTVRPRAPLSWLDPGVFGTLGVGGGFALAARLARPQSEVWLLYGDGSSAYSLAEFDTMVRHRVPVIAVVGNDAAWSQIQREQVPVLGDAVGTELRRTDYHVVAEGYGGRGLLLDDPAGIDRVLDEAQATARQGRPVLINAVIQPTAFRSGSISI